MAGTVDTHRFLRRLKTGVRLMVLGAHPDDEPSWQLAYFGEKLGFAQHVVIVTRGESGQNHIGTERYEELGALRSQEMQQAMNVLNCSHRLLANHDNTFQDFGYVKNAETTFRYWNKEALLDELVDEITRFKPHILLACFLDVPTEHGHHRAINHLALEGVRKAALKPDGWEVKKVYAPCSRDEASITIPAGDWDPLIGMSYEQLGEVSREYHRSQNVSRKAPVGSASRYLKRLDRFVPRDNLLAGLEYLSSLWPGLFFDEVCELFQLVNAPVELVHATHRLLGSVREISSFAHEEGRIVIERKVRELEQLSKAASQTSVRIEFPDLVHPGQDIDLHCHVHTGIGLLSNLTMLFEIPDWNFSCVRKVGQLEPNDVWKETISVAVPDEAPYYELYQGSICRVTVGYEVDGIGSQFSEDVELKVVPELSVKFQSPYVLVNRALGEKIVEFKTTVQNNANSSRVGVLKTVIPGVSGSPIRKVTLEPGEEHILRWEANTESLPEGEYRFYQEIDDHPGCTLTSIQYDHIQPTIVLKKAEMKCIVGSVEIPRRLVIGYVGAGTESISSALVQLGMEVVSLSDEQLLHEKLERYDVILVSPMAYRLRPVLAKVNGRLREYMRSGGHVVVMYHRPSDNWDPHKTPPYPLEIGYPSKQWRVTDPAAEVTPLSDHPFFSYPNILGPTDWHSWVRERGLYFPQAWDEQYVPLVSMADESEEPLRGGILTTEFGAGHYTFTCLTWHYQLEQGVLGAIRCFVNLIWPR